MKLRNLLLIVTVTFISGCLSPVKTNPPSSYVVNTLPRDIPVSRKHSSVILVAAPEARPIYQTTGMAYSNHPYQVQYFSENQWAETPAQMLQPLLVQTLQNTGRFSGVLMPPYAGQSTYMLNTQILRFEQDFVNQPHSFKLQAQVSLSRSASNQLIASKEFSISVPLPQESPYGGVLAANTATKRLLQEVARFVSQID